MKSKIIPCGAFDVVFKSSDPEYDLYHTLANKEPYPLRVQSYTDDLLNNKITMAIFAKTTTAELLDELPTFTIQLVDIIDDNRVINKTITVVEMLRITTSRKLNSNANAKYVVEFKYEVQ